MAPLESRAVFMYKRDVGQGSMERCNLAAVRPILAARPTPMAMTTKEDCGEDGGEGVKTLPTASTIRRPPSLRLRCRCSAPRTSWPPRRAPSSSAAGTGAERGAARPRSPPRTRSSLSSSEREHQPRDSSSVLLKYTSLGDDLVNHWKCQMFWGNGLVLRFMSLE